MLGKAPLTPRDVMMRLTGSMSTTAVCKKMACNGDLPGMASHIVRGIARYTAGATRLRMSIHMSLVSVVAHTMGLQLSGFPGRLSYTAGVPGSPSRVVRLFSRWRYPTGARPSDSLGSAGACGRVPPGVRPPAGFFPVLVSSTPHRVPEC